MHKASSYIAAQGCRLFITKEPEEDDIKEETHVAALSVSEQVLLMTCKVKVTTTDGSSTSEGSN